MVGARRGRRVSADRAGDGPGRTSSTVRADGKQARSEKRHRKGKGRRQADEDMDVNLDFVRGISDNGGRGQTVLWRRLVGSLRRARVEN